MIQGYHTKEIVNACIDYIAGMEPIVVLVSRYEGRLCGKGTIGKKRFNDEGYELVRKVHSSVLLHLDIVASYTEKHLHELHLGNKVARSEDSIVEQHKLEFSTRFKRQKQTMDL